MNYAVYKRKYFLLSRRSFLLSPLFYINSTSPSRGNSQKKTRDLPSENPLLLYYSCFFFVLTYFPAEMFMVLRGQLFFFFKLACADARRANGTRNGEQLT